MKTANEIIMDIDRLLLPDSPPFVPAANIGTDDSVARARRFSTLSRRGGQNVDLVRRIEILLHAPSGQPVVAR